MESPPRKDDGLVWRSTEHCPALDGLRGFAILMVSVYRFGQELDPASHPAIALVRRLVPAGQFGVDLFFVLSGFLITGILLRSKDKPHYYRNFIARRALRIFPLYFASLLLGMVVIPQLFGTAMFDAARDQQLYLWTYTSNLRMSWLNSWCFGPFDHFWSLAVEEHFYLVWPAIVLCFARQRLLWVCCTLILAVIVGRTLAAANPAFGVAIETLTLFRLDALCMGGALALLILKHEHYEALRRKGLWVMLVLLPVLIALLFTGKKVLALPSTICPAFMAAGMAVLLLSQRSSQLAKTFENRGLMFLGKYSYGMYVVQLPLVTALTPRSLAFVLPNDPILSAMAYVAFMFLLTILAALGTYFLIERPFLKMKSAFR